MMNMRDLGSKESVGVKFKEGIRAKKLWFESDQKESPKQSLNHFLKSLQKHPYADVLENRCY